MNGAQILGIFLVILVVVVICSSIRVVPQAHAYVIERLGTYNTTWSAGLHLKTPLIDKVAHRISMKEQVVDFAPQPVITKDNVTMRIDTVVFFQITDPKLFAYGVEKPIMAIENLTATTLRNIIGDAGDASPGIVEVVAGAAIEAVKGDSVESIVYFCSVDI